MRKAVLVPAVLGAALAVAAPALPAAASGRADSQPRAVAALGPTLAAGPSAALGPSVARGAAAAAAPMQAVPGQSWCRAVLPPPKGTARKAARIRAGRVDMGIYGWFRLASPPQWQPSPTLDTSGNSHVHGLHWAVPLLYRGMATGDRAMVDHFYEILRSWWATFPPESPRSGVQDQGIVAGMRLWTLTCASEMAAAAGQDPAVWSSVARIEAQRLLDRFAVASGTNNTALYAQSAALAATCQAGDAAGAARAAGNLSALADHLVLPDGSDLEGSPHYAGHALALLAKASRSADRCGLSHERLDAALARAQEFLAFATRPDRVLETLGDSPGSPPPRAVLVPGGPALFAATAGAAGRPPAALYRVFEGGYAFGRSWWRRPGGGRAGTASATWYSVRTGRGPAPTAHVHDDIGSVTFMARGVRWIGDPGPWRYDGSPLRRAMVGRAAHSALAVVPLPPPAPPLPPPGSPAAPAAPEPPGLADPAGVVPASPPADPGQAPIPPPAWTPPSPVPGSRLVTSRSEGGSDLTCVEDLTYPTAAITRCVAFQRGSGALVVEDTITARERSRVQGRWQVPPGVRVTRKGEVLTLRSGKRRATLALGGTPGGTVTTSRTWFTRSYGAKAGGTTVLRELDLEAGQSVAWRMELRVR